MIWYQNVLGTEKVGTGNICTMETYRGHEVMSTKWAGADINTEESVLGKCTPAPGGIVTTW